MPWSDWLPHSAQVALVFCVVYGFVLFALGARRK